MRLLHTSVAVVGITAAALLAWWLQHRPPAAGHAGLGQASAAVGAAAQDTGAVPVEVARVEMRAIDDDAQAVGTLRSHQGVVMRPEVSGRIAKIGFENGQRVRRGQLLVQLDDTLQRAQLQQALAQESIARTNLQRNRDLVAQNFVSASAVDQTAAALEVAQAQVALAQAQLARMRIVAPFDGQAGIRSVERGDYVKDGADLVAIEDLSSMWVDFRLAERYLARLKPGLAVDVQLDALPGRRYTGRVDAIDVQLDANGRSLLVRARLPNAQGELRPGMFARARTLFAVREHALLVPEEALVPLGGKQYVFKLVDGPHGRTGQRLEARLGTRVAGKAEILEGLQPGDLIVTAGQARLLRGEAVPVRIVEPAASAGGTPAPGRAASAV